MKHKEIEADVDNTLFYYINEHYDNDNRYIDNKKVAKLWIDHNCIEYVYEEMENV